jgi:hypothetical protein
LIAGDNTIAASKSKINGKKIEEQARIIEPSTKHQSSIKQQQKNCNDGREP